MKRNNLSRPLPVIGITGGVGAGKSVVLSMLREHFHAEIIQADLVARELMEPGRASYRQVAAHFGKEILAEDGTIDRTALASLVFCNPQLLEELNGLTHPEVKKEITRRIEEIQKRGTASCIALEAALLIEGGYEAMLDSLWYIYADKETRLRRLEENRGYSREKSHSIMEQQLGEEEFRTHCDVVIDNSHDREMLYRQLKTTMQDKFGVFCRAKDSCEGRKTEWN